MSLESAFTRVCADATSAACDSFFPQAWLDGTPVMWTHGEAPTPVAFDRAHSTTSISASDSASFFAAVARMIDDLGWPVFKPASGLGPTKAQGTVPGAVLIVVDSTLPAGTEDVTRYTMFSYLNSARVRVRSAFDVTNRAEMTHLLFHALGFGHTCAWPSIMGGYGCAQANSITAQDAIGWAFADQIAGTYLLFSPTTNLVDALRGEETLEFPATP